MIQKNYLLMIDSILHVYKRKNIQKEKNLTMDDKSDIFNIGDLVAIKHSGFAPFFVRGKQKGVGIIIDIDKSLEFRGIIYYVQTTDGVWKFSDYELELLNESR